uniref:Uncharacterized protein n=1 Tax=Ficedula albicollis TaxID=59894 RepID=A0A803WAL9_FICAL
MLNQYLGEKGGLGVKQGPNKLNVLKMQRLEPQSQLSFQREANVRTGNFRKTSGRVFFGKQAKSFILCQELSVHPQSQHRRFLQSGWKSWVGSQ